MLGTDIIEIDRIRKAAKNERFLKSVYTEYELEYCMRRKNYGECLAGIFCAKEAVIKALDLGALLRALRQVEIQHTMSGKPYVVLSEQLAPNAQGKTIHISISHSKHYATAVAILV